MNAYPNQDLHTQDPLLDSIERAIKEKARLGRANEARYGLAARVANAAPPVNEAFRRALRARVLSPGSAPGRQADARQDRARPAFQWGWAGLVLAAMLIVIAVFTYRPAQIVEQEGVPVGPPGPAGRLAVADLDALAETLNRAEGPRTVVVYPDVASPIAERVQHETVSLALGADRSPAAISGAVRAILPASGYVDLVLAAAEEDETTRRVRVAMERSLYRLYHPSGQADVAAYGALERSAFVAAPAEGNLEPVGAVFEGSVELVAGGVLDDPQPGTPVRMAFDWRIQEPVSDSLVMFVHVLRDGVELVAQRDAIPGNGLWPVTEWQPGEVVRDQFALLLPPTLPAGEYEIQVGLYDAATQMRHSLVEPEGGTTVVVGAWTIDTAQQREDGAESSRPASQL